jgi:hypothetical protein
MNEDERKAGLSVRWSSSILGLASFVLGGIGVIAEYYHCPQVIMFFIFCFIFIAYLIINRTLRYRVTSLVSD